MNLTEKIDFPSAPAYQPAGRGLLPRNLRASVDGAHPVPSLEPLAGFSHPRNPKISRGSLGPDCSGETNFLQPNMTRSYLPGREALATGRIGFGFIRNLTSGRWKADGPSESFSEGERRRDSNDGSCRFLRKNPTEARAMGLSAARGSGRDCLETKECQ